MSDTQKNFHKKFLGRSGEGRAARYLWLRGYRILKRNFTCSIGEVDIIAKKRGVYVFVEVKTRLTNKYGRPSDAVTKAKQNKYRMMATLFLQRTGDEDCPVRFDVIEILGRELNHIENAF